MVATIVILVGIVVSVVAFELFLGSPARAGRKGEAEIGPQVGVVEPPVAV